MTRRNVAVIGGGNGGQAMAADLAMRGHAVRLYSRRAAMISAACGAGGIVMKGALCGTGQPALITDNLADAVRGAEIIMMVTTADAHAAIARALAPLLEDGQLVVLNPGRTGGALEVRHVLKQCGVQAQVQLAEAQSLVYACRSEAPGQVHVIGVKDNVLLAALPARDTACVVARLAPLYTCFRPAAHVLETSLENIGCVLHPAVVLFNAAAIERGTRFFFYRDMTPMIAAWIRRLDDERRAVAAAYGLRVRTAEEWICYAYDGADGADLCERMRRNPAYSEILAPACLRSRMLTEDVPTGLVPMRALAALAHVPTPLMTALITAAEALLDEPFSADGRTLARMGITAASPHELITALH